MPTQSTAGLGPGMSIVNYWFRPRAHTELLILMCLTLPPGDKEWPALSIWSPLRTVYLFWSARTSFKFSSLCCCKVFVASIRCCPAWLSDWCCGEHFLLPLLDSDPLNDSVSLAPGPPWWDCAILHSSLCLELKNTMDTILCKTTTHLWTFPFLPISC